MVAVAGGSEGALVGAGNGGVVVGVGGRGVALGTMACRPQAARAAAAPAAARARKWRRVNPARAGTSAGIEIPYPKSPHPRHGTPAVIAAPSRVSAAIIAAYLI